MGLYKFSLLAGPFSSEIPEKLPFSSPNFLYTKKLSPETQLFKFFWVRGQFFSAFVVSGWSHAKGMTNYLNANSIRIFDFSDFSQPLTEQVRQNAQRIADENGIEIEFIRKLRAFRKDERIQEIISKTGKTEGLLHIFSAMEQCNTYKPWHDKTTGRTFLKFDQSKCLHYYFYFIDKELGLIYLLLTPYNFGPSV